MHRRSAIVLISAAAALAGSTTAATAPEPAGGKLPSAFEAGWRGKQVCEPLFENDRMRAARCTFPPGVGHERHFHPPHWGYVVSGATMRITDSGGTHDRVLATGSNWWSAGVDWHEGVNITPTTAVYIIVEPKP